MESDKNMLEYYLGLYLYSLHEAYLDDTLVLGPGFMPGLKTMLDEWLVKYDDILNEHLKIGGKHE